MEAARERSPFVYLKWISGVLFSLSFASTVCAGLLFNDIRWTESRFLPETWEAMMNDRGVPQGMHFGLSVAVSLGLGAVAGMIYAFAAVAERMLRSR